MGPFYILLCLTADDFTCQYEKSRREGVNLLHEEKNLTDGQRLIQPSAPTVYSLHNKTTWSKYGSDCIQSVMQSALVLNMSTLWVT